jgi:hypothetical protein
MSEDKATYEGRFCGNCGLRVDGDCTLDRAEMEECLLTPGRSHWRKLATDREQLEEFIRAGRGEPVAQCTERPEEHEDGCICFDCTQAEMTQKSNPESGDTAYKHYKKLKEAVTNHPVDLDTINNPYNRLQRVLQDAEYQAADGKGKERHATDNQYEDQVICVVGRLLRGHPYGSHAYQVIKKTIEAGRLYKIKGPGAAYEEVLGAINYAAAMNILIAEDE